MPTEKKSTAKPRPKTPCDHVVRGFFDLERNHGVRVTCNADFLLYIWARNADTSQGGIAVYTPPSQFRGTGATGPEDWLVLDVPAQSGLDLGCIGAQGGEVIHISNANPFHTRVTLFLTVITAHGATATMNSTRSSWWMA